MAKRKATSEKLLGNSPWGEGGIFNLYINTRTEMKAKIISLDMQPSLLHVFSNAWAVNSGTHNVFDQSSMITDTSYLNNV